MPKFRQGLPKFRSAVPKFRFAVSKFRSGVSKFSLAVQEFRSAVPKFRSGVPRLRANVSEAGAEIAALAALVAEGLEQAAEDFPTPPVPATDLRAKLDTFEQTRAATVVAETGFREQHAMKDEALEDLTDSTKADLKYAEFAVKDRPEKLNQLGWGRRRGRFARWPRR